MLHIRHSSVLTEQRVRAQEREVHNGQGFRISHTFSAVQDYKKGAVLSPKFIVRVLDSTTDVNMVRVSKTLFPSTLFYVCAAAVAPKLASGPHCQRRKKGVFEVSRSSNRKCWPGSYKAFCSQSCFGGRGKSTCLSVSS